jgi:DNA-binding transcriptional regulator YhcF (GntR family)
MSPKKTNNYEVKILEALANSPSGSTITELSNETGIHRNTVSKYLTGLEGEGSVKKKEIGAARLYFSKKRKFLKKKLVNSFLQALLNGLKEFFPNKEEVFKKIGIKILEHFQFPIGLAYTKEFEKVRDSDDYVVILKLFKEFYNSYDFFQEDLDIQIVELHQNKVIYRLQNSEYLNQNYIYFFYIACGITEGIYLQNLNLEVNCNVKNINLAKNSAESYIDISLEIQ